MASNTAGDSESSLPVQQANISLIDTVPDNCTIQLPEGVTIPSPQMFSNILGVQADSKDANHEDVPPIGNDLLRPLYH